MSSIYTGLHNLIRNEGYNVVDFVQQVNEMHGKSTVFTKGKGRLIFRQYMIVGHVREYMDVGRFVIHGIMNGLIWCNCIITGLLVAGCAR